MLDIRNCLGALGTAIAATLAYPLALATEPASSGDALEEVIVTATRQGVQSVQTVPMAITVVSPADLDAKGLSGVSDFINTLPSVNMQSNSPGVNSIEMRGLVTTFPDITALQDRSLTSVYLDDAPISIQTANPDLMVYDLERIEVIRGPQGTLYGAGSMAGTIRLITRKPDSHEFSGSGDVSVSETKHGGTNYSVRAAVNLPITENVLAVRLNGYRGEDSGFIDNIQLGRKDANDSETTQGRAAIRWTPTDKLILDATATFAELDAHGNYDTYPSLGPYTYESLTPEGFDDHFKLYNLALDDDLDFSHLIASVSYQDRDFTDYRSFQYQDEYLLTPGLLLPAAGFQINTVRDATEEVRLVSNPNQPLRWTFGAFNENYHRNYLQLIDSPGSDAAVGINSVTEYGTPQPDQPFWGPIDVKEHQLALFGETTYEVVPRLDITLGARYFDFRQDFNLYFAGIFGSLGPGQPLTRSDVQESSGVNPRAVASYHVSDTMMLYAEAARGFRYGGVNLPVPLQFCGAELNSIGLSNAPVTFGPDHLWNYEIGEKGEFFDRKLLFNLTGFFIDWSDVQTTHDLACGYPFIQNSGNITSKGVELESKAKLGQSVTLSLNGSFTDATADGAIPNLSAPSGARAPYFPRTIVSAGVTYVTQLSSGEVRWAADWTYRSNAYTQFDQNSPLNLEIPSQNLLDASITYAVNRWQFAAYGTNLTNNMLISTYVYLKNQYAPYQPDNQTFIGRPRTVGLRLHRDF